MVLGRKIFDQNWIFAGSNLAIFLTLSGMRQKVTLRRKVNPLRVNQRDSQHRH